MTKPTTTIRRYRIWLVLVTFSVLLLPLNIYGCRADRANEPLRLSKKSPRPGLLFGHEENDLRPNSLPGKYYIFNGKRYNLLETAKGYTAEGVASWYGRRFHGKRTSSGERYNMNDLTAAHRTLPFDTLVRVINLKNNRSVTVRINDRGPFSESSRIIDLSYAGAKRLGIVRAGMAEVRLEVIPPPKPRKISQKILASSD